MKQAASCVLATVIVLSFPVVNAQQPTNLDLAAWETINKKIVDAYRGLDTSAPSVLSIHMMTVPKALPIDDPEAFKAAYFDLADTIPAWSPTWSPLSQFADTYRLFAESIAIPRRSDVTQAAYNTASRRYKTATDQRNAAYRAVLREWSRYVAAQQKAKAPILPWNLWLNQQSATGARFNELEASRSNDQATMYNVYDAGARVIGGFKEQMLNYRFDPSADIIESAPRYPYNYASARAALTQLGKDSLANQNAGHEMFSWDGSKDTLHRAEERSSWGANASLAPFFGIRVGASGSGTHYSLDQSEGGASVSIKAYGFGRVSVLPGAWYAPPLVTWFKTQKGTFLPGAPLTNDQALWGQGGLLSLRPIELIVMIRPTLTAKLSKSDFKKVVDTLNIGGSVSFGPFSFGGSYSKTTETIDKNEEKGLITFTNNSDTPYVIAVISQRL